MLLFDELDACTLKNLGNPPSIFFFDETTISNEQQAHNYRFNLLNNEPAIKIELVLVFAALCLYY